MTSPDLSGLIERVEAAKGPDREIDAAIVMALYPEAQIGEYAGYEDVVFHATPLVPNKELLPFFTASLDAAMTLVPGGSSLHLHMLPHSSTQAIVGIGHESIAATPALALVAASLRSQKEQANG